MIEYSLENSNGDRYQLNDSSVIGTERESMSLGSDNFAYDKKIEPKSGQAGSVALGESRVKEREITIFFVRAYQDYQDFRTKANELLAFLRDVIYVVDETNNRKISVASIAYDIPYETGSYQHVSDDSITFVALNPFWEDTTIKTVTQSLIGGDINDVPLMVSGALEVQPTITLTATLATATLQMYISETKQGLEWNDSIYGTSGFEEVVIDNQQGTLTIGTLDRTQNIATGTGFFEIPVGTSTLKVIPAENVDISISWFERYYV